MTTPSKQIPIKRVQINHLSELPNDYGTTPGGTMFSTTPGGTRIVYDRSFLLKCRSSPHANTPPRNLPDIPGVTIPEKQKSRHVSEIKEEPEPRPNDHKDEDQFEMEI